MSTTELFKKHFGSDAGSVNLKHPNAEAFFEELNKECLRENHEAKVVKAADVYMGDTSSKGSIYVDHPEDVDKIKRVLVDFYLFAEDYIYPKTAQG